MYVTQELDDLVHPYLIFAPYRLPLMRLEYITKQSKICHELPIF